MTDNEAPAPKTDPIVELIGRSVAGYFTDATGRTEPEAGDLDLAFDIRTALTAAGWGDLRSLAGQFTARADTHDSVADRWTSEDREQALIDSGIAAGYRGAAELALKLAAAGGAGLAAVLNLHNPVRRYLPTESATDSYPTAEAALKEHLRDSMRGYESVPRDRAADMPYFEICKECSRVENAAHDDGYGSVDDGSDLIVVSSKWPCATYTAATAGADAQLPREAEALRAVATVLDRWENGALVNKGDYEGIVWMEPLWPLPAGADEIQAALRKYRDGAGA